MRKNFIYIYLIPLFPVATFSIWIAKNESPFVSFKIVAPLSGFVSISTPVGRCGETFIKQRDAKPSIKKCLL